MSREQVSPITFNIAEYKMFLCNMVLRLFLFLKSNFSISLLTYLYYYLDETTLSETPWTIQDVIIQNSVFLLDISCRSYLMILASVAIIVAIEATEVPMVIFSAVLILLTDFSGITISQPGSGLALWRTFDTMPFM